MKHTNDLGRDRVFTLVLRLTVPTMIAQLVNVLYCIVDRIYIGNIPGDGALALAGAGICGPIVTLLSSFGMLAGLGGSILFSIRLGAGKEDEAKQILNNSFLMLVVMSIVLTVGFLLLKSRMLYFFGASGVVYPYADTYLTIYTAGTFFALMAAGLNYFITCQGYPMLGMATVVIGAVCNIILDPVFIFGMHMGIGGAAAATVLSQMVSCGFVLKVLLGKKIPVRIGLGGYSLKLIRRICLLGLSPFLILATDSIIIIALNAVLQSYGGTGAGDTLIAAATVVQSYMMLITGPMLGISGGSQPLISYNYGAKQMDRVRQAIRTGLIVCLCFTAFMFGISHVLPRYFARIFIRDAECLRLSVWGIKVYTAAVIPLSFQYILVDALTALGATGLSLPLSLFRKGSFLAATFLLPAYFGARYAFYAEPLSDFVASAVTTVVFLAAFPRVTKKVQACN